MLNEEDPVHAAIPPGRTAGWTAARTAVTAADLHRPVPRRQGTRGARRGTRPACRAAASRPAAAAAANQQITFHHPDGEYQASKRLAMAANVMARDPAALQLRLLQTVVEVAAERNSTLVMPVPVELLRFFEKMTPAGPGAELSPSLADFGDAEAAQAEADI